LTTTRDLALLACTAGAAKHKEFPGGLGRRRRHRRHDTIARRRRDIRLVVDVDVPRVGGGGTRQIVTRRVDMKGGRACRVIQLTLDVRQACRRQLPHVRLGVLETSRD